MRLTLTRKVQAGFALAALMLVTGNVLAYRTVRRARASEELVEHTHRVRDQLLALRSAATDVQSGARGFALTGDARFLRPYYAGLATIRDDLHAVEALATDDSLQQRRISILRELVLAQLRLADSVVRLRRAATGDAAARLVSTRDGERGMMRLREILADLQGQESRLLQARDADAAAQERRLVTLIAWGNVLAVLLLGLGARFIERDIAERQRVESAIRESDERFRLLVDGVRDYGLVLLDPHGCVVSWNEGAERMYGYRADEIIGRDVSVFYVPDYVALGKPFDELQSAIAHERHESEGMRVRKDGTQFTAHVILAGLFDDAGKVRGFAAVSRDMTERRRIEEMLHRQNTMLESILSSIGDGIIVADEHGALLMHNPAAETMLAPARHHADRAAGNGHGLYLPDTVTELTAEQSPLARAIAGESVDGIEMLARSARHPDGIWLRCTGRPLRDDSGSIHGGVLAFQDVTTLKRTQEQLTRQAEELARSNTELQQFAYVASHDLQEPLRMVASYTQLLARRYRGKLDADADEFIAFAVDGATRMQRLIEDLLAYSRVGTKGREFRDTACDAVLDRALLNLRALIEESGARVSRRNLPVLPADEPQLVQLLQNLIANAIKFRGARAPEVAVSAERCNDGEWTFAVEDNGIGIEAQYFDRIFTMFQRLHGRDEYPGSGMGLAICKKIVQRHGGRIWLRSTPGEGTTFFFTLREAPAT